MTVARARRVLADNGIHWAHYFDLVQVEQARAGNWVGCESVREAIVRVKRFLSTGK